jgi:uncharacterized membrane protein YfcA
VPDGSRERWPPVAARCIEKIVVTAFVESLVSHPLAFETALFATSVLAGTVGAVLGIGGAMLIIPLLTLVFDVPLRNAVGVSIVSIIATSSGAAAAFLRDRLTNVRVAVLLEVATASGAVLGALLAGLLPERALFVLFAVLVLWSAAAMYRHREDQPIAPEASDRWAKALGLASRYPDAVLKKEVPYGVTGVPVAFALMGVAGLAAGLLGIGSGALKVPAMDRCMRLPIKVSSATSNFMIGVTASAAAGVYFLRGDVVPLLAAPVALGVLLGSWLGSRLLVRTSSRAVRLAFVTFLLFVAVQLVAKAVKGAP